MAEKSDNGPLIAARVDQGVKKRYDDISAQIGGKASDTIVALLDAYEHQAAKAAIPGREGDVNRFHAHVNVLETAYMGALAEVATLGDTFDAQYSEKLKSKDSIIQELQQAVQTANQAKEDAVKARGNAEDLTEALKRQLSEAQNRIGILESALKDKDSVNDSLRQVIRGLETRAETLEDSAKQAGDLKEELDAAKKQIAGLERQKELMELEKTSLKLQMEKTHQEELFAARSRHQEEIDGYQAAYRELLEHMGLGNLPKE